MLVTDTIINITSYSLIIYRFETMRTLHERVETIASVNSRIFLYKVMPMYEITISKSVAN